MLYIPEKSTPVDAPVRSGTAPEAPSPFADVIKELSQAPQVALESASKAIAHSGNIPEAFSASMANILPTLFLV